MLTCGQSLTSRLSTILPSFYCFPKKILESMPHGGQRVPWLCMTFEMKSLLAAKTIKTLLLQHQNMKSTIQNPLL